MSSGTAGGAERRVHARFPIRLPVTVTLFTSPLVHIESPKARAPSSTEPIVIQAMALDLSERGLCLGVAAGSLQAVLDASDPLVGLEFAFMHDELRHIGPRKGHVQWRRAGSDRNTLSLGARLDVAFTAEEFSAILRCSTNKPKSRRPVAVVLAATALLGTLVWYRAERTDAAEHNATTRRLSAAEEELVQLKYELDRCLASQNPSRPVEGPFALPNAPAGRKAKLDLDGYDAARAIGATDAIHVGEDADASETDRRDATR